jgi:hypothetical protein
MVAPFHQAAKLLALVVGDCADTEPRPGGRKRPARRQKSVHFQVPDASVRSFPPAMEICSSADKSINCPEECYLSLHRRQEDSHAALLEK